MTTTKSALATGSAATKWIAVIEGYPRLLTDADPTKALTAWSGTDFSLALGGLVVECRNQQQGDPHDPFANQGGTLTLHMPQDAADTFGIEVNRRGAGAFTSLASTIDRNDTALTIKFGDGFTSSGEAYIGTECVAYSSKTTTTMTVSTRGKYSDVGVASSGSGASNRFASHHRVALDQNQVQNNPSISQQPRRWLGRRAYLYMHTVDSAGDLNTRANAQRVFAGRITGISDDPNTFCTVVQCEHVLHEVGGAVLLRNQWGGTVRDGIYIPAGAVFKHVQSRAGTTKSANDLTVVASGASGSNQINAGYYSLEEICAFLNAWLGGEKAAARIDGSYSWQSPISTTDGVRTVIDWQIADASSTTYVWWQTSMPSGVGGLLGFSAFTGQSVIPGASFVVSKSSTQANTVINSRSPNPPSRVAVFSKGSSSGGALPTFKLTAENERGEFVDQYDLMPSVIKPGMDPGKPWGLFLIDEKLLIFGSYASGVVSDVFVCPPEMGGDPTVIDSFYSYGRKADDDSGPVTIRQVFDLEGSLELLVNVLFYNTGTSGYNHGTYDLRAYGLGVGLPGGLLGTPFERSVSNLPQVEQVCRLRFDEPKTLAELIGGELLARRAFPVWKDGGIVFAQWHTPVTPIATFSLSDSNKASPAGHQENHRTPTIETTQHARPVVKIDFNPDFAFGRDDRYRASIQLEDQVAIDDGGGDVTRPLTIKLRNQPGTDAPPQIAGYLAGMPMTSRPSKFLERSIDVKLAEGIAPGDIATITDNFARDPLTGLRKITSRAAVVMRHEFDFGGPVPGRPQDKPRPMGGKVELNFFDVNRGSIFGPCAQVDETQSAGGFTSGYNSSTRELWTYDHKHSEASEPIDASNFAAPYAVTIVEIDPADPASPTFWERIVESVSGSKIKITVALSSPSFDSAKKYRIIFSKYSLCTAIQRDDAYFADDADEMVEDVEVPYHFCATPEIVDYSLNGTERGQNVASLSYGDGKSVDVGHEKALFATLNALDDYKMAHQGPCLWTEQPSAGALNVWTPRLFGLYFFGFEGLSNAVYRYLTLAPFLALDTTNGAGTGNVRVTVSRQMPQQTAWTTTPTYFDPSYTDFAQQLTWSTSTTTWATGADQQISLLAKDLWFSATYGCVFILLETKNAWCRGLAKCIEGPRVLIL